ncbi:hypothetical protein D3C72_1982240 [compost metagenome]
MIPLAERVWRVAPVDFGQARVLTDLNICDDLGAAGGYRRVVTSMVGLVPGTTLMLSILSHHSRGDENGECSGSHSLGVHLGLLD